MSGRLKKFVARAPRYILRPSDPNAMRFSLQSSHGTGGIEETILLNLSETGMAFVVNAGNEPHLGERIKVEIPIPNEKQIAWWARVVRVGEFDGGSHEVFGEQEKVVVALRFDELPEPYSRAIRRGIEKSMMRAMREQEYRTFAYYRAMFWLNFAKIALWLILSVMAAGFIYWFSQPDTNYDAVRGSQWGDRFKF